MTATEAEVVGKALRGQRNGRGWICRCPAHDDRTPSLSISSGSDGRLLVYCHAGCAAVDVFAELRRLGILDSREPVNCHGAVTNRSAAIVLPDPAEEADRQRRIDRAIDIYHVSGSIRGTLGERYLIEHRLIIVTRDPEIDPCLFDRLRFHAACPFRRNRAPAIVAAVTGPAGYLRGMWRIRLDGFGRRVERLGLGDCRGGAVRLVPALDDDHIAVAEGVEDALAFMQIAKIPTWAGCSTTGMAGMALPPRFKRVTVVADADPWNVRADGTRYRPGIDAAQRLASRLKAEGRAVRIIRPPTGSKDANAALQAGEAE